VEQLRNPLPERIAVMSFHSPPDHATTTDDDWSEGDAAATKRARDFSSGDILQLMI